MADKTTDTPEAKAAKARLAESEREAQAARDAEIQALIADLLPDETPTPQPSRAELERERRQESFAEALRRLTSLGVLYATDTDDKEALLGLLRSLKTVGQRAARAIAGLSEAMLEHQFEEEEAAREEPLLRAVEAEESAR